MWHLYAHPLAQMAATALGFGALWLGLARARSLHFGVATPFRRRWHALLGQMTLYTWLGGGVFGALAAWDYWGLWLHSGAHATVGLVMAPLVLFGLISGLIMLRRPRRRKALPLAHGLACLTALALAVAQFFSGRELMAQLVPGL